MGRMVIICVRVLAQARVLDLGCGYNLDLQAAGLLPVSRYWPFTVRAMDWGFYPRPPRGMDLEDDFEG